MSPPRQSFSFDRVFGQEASQEEVFVEISELVQSALDGKKVCIMAYGQTGSQITHTMMGSSSEQGLIPRSLQKIFQAQATQLNGWKYNMEVSVLEFYNETMRDLVSGSNLIYERYLTLTNVSSDQGVLQLLEEANKKRSVAGTKSNEFSSRSHLIVSVYTE